MENIITWLFWFSLGSVAPFIILAILDRGITSRRSVGITLNINGRRRSRTVSWRQGFRVRTVAMPVFRGFKISK